MTGRIISCNLARPATLEAGGKTIRTGIFKEPVDREILLEAGGVFGDIIADPRVHGGPRKAVYAYPSEHYPWWAERLGRDGLPWGTLGENLTIQGFDESTVHVGDRFRVGGALVEVSTPRQPCFKLALKLGTKEVMPWMIDSGYFGFYFAVLEAGEVRAGDTMELLPVDPANARGISVRERGWQKAR